MDASSSSTGPPSAQEERRDSAAQENCEGSPAETTAITISPTAAHEPLEVSGEQTPQTNEKDSSEAAVCSPTAQETRRSSPAVTTCQARKDTGFELATTHEPPEVSGEQADQANEKASTEASVPSQTEQKDCEGSPGVTITQASTATEVELATPHEPSPASSAGATISTASPATEVEPTAAHEPPEISGKVDSSQVPETESAPQEALCTSEKPKKPKRQLSETHLQAVRQNAAKGRQAWSAKASAARADPNRPKRKVSEPHREALLQNLAKAREARSDMARRRQRRRAQGLTVKDDREDGMTAENADGGVEIRGDQQPSETADEAVASQAVETRQEVVQQMTSSAVIPRSPHPAAYNEVIAGRADEIAQEAVEWMASSAAMPGSPHPEIASEAIACQANEDGQETIQQMTGPAVTPGSPQARASSPICFTWADVDPSEEEDELVSSQEEGCRPSQEVSFRQETTGSTDHSVEAQQQAVPLEPIAQSVPSPAVQITLEAPRQPVVTDDDEPSLFIELKRLPPGIRSQYYNIPTNDDLLPPVRKGVTSDIVEISSDSEGGEDLDTGTKRRGRRQIQTSVKTTRRQKRVRQEEMPDTSDGEYEEENEGEEEEEEEEDEEEDEGEYEEETDTSDERWGEKRKARALARARRVEATRSLAKSKVSPTKRKRKVQASPTKRTRQRRDPETVFLGFFSPTQPETITAKRGFRRTVSAPNASSSRETYPAVAASSSHSQSSSQQSYSQSSSQSTRYSSVSSTTRTTPSTRSGTFSTPSTSFSTAASSIDQNLLQRIVREVSERVYSEMAPSLQGRSLIRSESVKSQVYEEHFPDLEEDDELDDRQARSSSPFDPPQGSYLVDVKAGMERNRELFMRLSGLLPDQPER
ncbi:hypothetical protein PSEUBRA_001003 [Kalmanozyma brasiliensis GHG001]|uniref:uncharacterized protein n=1 Tax=Kalmanozyma brasiliensis (strain GHG001) TaxID=1365824 RepID=UPI001CE7B451|nr:uncharacterized protein PSEUBRA_001003 [Kalmanozyma brasiliensis GHG001]KAF6766874.1 hypothetical protein PSEUBRA_001003 [Kalmanozyma brasiliensis GHG001]